MRRIRRKTSRGRSAAGRRLRWAYERLRKSLENVEYDVLVVHSPHWRTQVGTHFLGLPHFKSLSVDPVFPNLFRYHYDLNVDVDLSKAIHDEAEACGPMETQMMTNPNFRIDYGTIISCHLTNPGWDKPIVAISSNGAARYFNMDVMQAMMIELGKATRRAIEKSGRRAVLLASNSLSHRHFVVEPDLPEDMSKEHIINHNQYLWDMRMIDLMKKGKTREIAETMTDFTEQAGFGNRRRQFQLDALGDGFSDQARRSAWLRHGHRDRQRRGGMAVGMSEAAVENPVQKGFLLPGLPHILLCPEKNPGWKKCARRLIRCALRSRRSIPIFLMIYSTYWPSIIGHQIQADPNPEWVHVDEEFHELGSIPYKMKIDAEFAKLYVEKAKARGLHARTIAYKGFPIDTGSVVVSKLINPDNRLPAVIVSSSNVYSDRAETLVLGKAGRDAVEASGKKAVAIIVSSLSNRLHTQWVDPKDDKIHSLKDQEWNLKFLEFLEAGRLEDVSQLSRQFHREARVNKVANFKPFWWLAAVMGQTNMFTGQVFEYQPIYGTGAAVVGLTPSPRAARDLEFDESDPENYPGERNVLGPSGDEETKPATEQEAFGREL